LSIEDDVRVREEDAGERGDMTIAFGARDAWSG
jgi:hypothetical protein